MSYAPIKSQISLTTRNNFSETIPARERIPSKHSRRRKKVESNGAIHSRNGEDNYPIIVHCHLCWDWVWQRPQQFLSRLSARHKILFIETIGPDPQLATSLAHFRVEEKFPNITILRL